MDGEVVDVEQDDSVIDCAGTWVETSGLGPCIGVAVVFGNRVSMIHQSNPYVSDGLKEFCEALDGLIPAAARASVHPIVAGGQLGEFQVEILRDRRYVLSKLNELGFGDPQVKWCPDDATHGIVVNTSTRTAELEVDMDDGRRLTERLVF
ncbi:hypothetical protein [Ralstonia sp. ASV6]|uniref:hypothetical protein n=1 Tax=Ralstonia sp. ASV6 TaxID=2795124 RepID=UPI0018ED17EE|nr:hypothetical protein [Ralstonia sp. ASV6]